MRASHIFATVAAAVVSTGDVRRVDFLTAAGSASPPVSTILIGLARGGFFAVPARVRFAPRFVLAVSKCAAVNILTWASGL